MDPLLDPTDPRHLTPQQRLDELSAALATGGVRMHPVSGPSRF